VEKRELGIWSLRNILRLTAATANTSRE